MAGAAAASFAVRSRLIVISVRGHSQGARRRHHVQTMVANNKHTRAVDGNRRMSRFVGSFSPAGVEINGRQQCSGKGK
ncbi:hypothetical protein TSUD_147980 [Trifolium subterraneum]|uniref:Uncharacterized protein n=1 Tax=Trifolium subterraneum TaxID=3900 RepID=A0A2Z6P7S0_TRISU|nr:hypothetical protein TSUD_147980 [Trifolium subterraneum]